MRTWVDSSTLIALDAAGKASILRDLLERVAITREVAEEVFNGRESQALRNGRGDWIDVVPVRGDRRRWESLGLGRGEASLFLTPSRDRLVLDEIPARTVAEAEGREYVGLLGLIAAGVHRRSLSPGEAKGVLRRLLQSGFRVATDLYDEILREIDLVG